MTDATVAAADAAAAARIFVGGMSESVSVEDLRSIFSSLGTVRGVDIVRDNFRNFAYVDFACDSEKGLAKLFSTYNGCKWKGGKLRLEKAKRHYLDRLNQEREEASKLSSPPCDAELIKGDSPVEHVDRKDMKLRIYIPRLRKVKAVPFKGSGKHKYSFQRIVVPSLPVHFCDCEEHCGPLEAANDKYIDALESAAHEVEKNMINAVMNKIFEGENGKVASFQMNNKNVGIAPKKPSVRKLRSGNAEESSERNLGDLNLNKGSVQPSGSEDAEEYSEENLDGLILNIVSGRADDFCMEVKEHDTTIGDQQLKKHQRSKSRLPEKKRRKTLHGVQTQGSDHQHTKESSTSDTAPSQTRSECLPSASKSTEAMETPVEETSGNEPYPNAQNAVNNAGTKGASWTQKAVWRELVGESGNTSFSLSEVLPYLVPPSAPAVAAKEVAAFTDGASNQKRNSDKSLKPSLAADKLFPAASTGGKITSAEAAATPDCEKSNKSAMLEDRRTSQPITVSEVCPFMRNADSAKQWMKAKKSVSGFIKKIAGDKDAPLLKGGNLRRR